MKFYHRAPIGQNGPMSAPRNQRWIIPAATIAAAVVAIALFAGWLVERPVVANPRSLQLPLMAELVYLLSTRSSAALTQVVLAIIAFTGVVASSLAIVLAWRSAAHASARRLAAALVLISLSVAYFFFVLPPEQYWIAAGGRPTGAARFALDLLGYSLLAAGLWQLGSFFEIYPRPIGPGDWNAFVDELKANEQKKARAGWRARVYGEKWKAAGEKHWRGLYFDRWQGPHNGSIMAILLFASALMLAASDVYQRHIKPAPAGEENPAAMLYALLVGIGTAALLLSLTRNFRILEFHHTRGLPDDRTRIEWIYSTTFAGSIVALGLPLLGMLAFTVLTFTAGEESVRYSIDLLMLFPYALAVPLFALSFLAAVSLSIFYRGAVDPRLAARKVTVWWLLGAAVAILFIFVERAVAVRIVHWLGLPTETGLVFTGAVVAATIAPIRHQAESTVTALVGRLLPIEQLMDGERKRAVVAMSDLSGYTALSVQDEKQALLIAALLHRNASVISQAHGGRMVKSIGDAVMLEFRDADSAAKALLQLHAEFPAACRAMGFEPLPVHSGAHVGEVVVGHDKDLFGQTVNLAARLQGEAKSGQIVVSDAFVAERNAAPDTCRALGPRRLKNIPEAVDCHELVASA